MVATGHGVARRARSPEVDLEFLARQVEVADLRIQLLRETLEARIRTVEARLDALEQA
jgi:hypothetical protein